MGYKAFVSSTFEDLKDHRREVIDALRDSGIHVDPMENWTASQDEPKVFCQERLEGCDFCVLLVGFRAGFVPDGESKSITQLEHQAAVKRGIDVLVFMLKDGTPWLRDFDDRSDDDEPETAIDRWRAELLKTKGVGWFGLEPDSVEVGGAVNRWIQDALRASPPRSLQTGPRVPPTAAQNPRPGA